MMIIHGIVNTFGVFFNPLLTEFASTRAAISAANSLAFLTTGCAAIFMGLLSDRFGPRAVLTTCAVFFGVGHLLMSQVSTLWQTYLCFIVIGIGFSSSDVVPLSIVVRWFVKKRGMMSGIMKVGTGLGIMVMPLVASVLIGKLEWRNAYLILGTMVLVVVIPLVQLLQRDPQTMGLLPDGEAQPDVKSPLLAEEG